MCKLAFAMILAVTCLWRRSFGISFMARGLSRLSRRRWHKYLHYVIRDPTLIALQYSLQWSRLNDCFLWTKNVFVSKLIIALCNRARETLKLFLEAKTVKRESVKLIKKHMKSALLNGKVDKILRHLQRDCGVNESSPKRTRVQQSPSYTGSIESKGNNFCWAVATRGTTASPCQHF